MLDPASAIGLAASIVQIIDFTANVLNKSHEYRTSEKGILVQHAEIETAAASFGKLMLELDNNTRDLKSLGSPSESFDDELRTLSKGLQDILRSLLEKLDELKVQGEKHRTWKSVRQSIRSVWNEDKIRELEQRLERYRKHVDTVLLVSLRYVISLSL